MRQSAARASHHLAVNAFHLEAEPRCGSAVVPAGHLAAVAAERASAPFAASVAGAAAPSPVYEQHWLAVAPLADDPAPAAAPASDAPPAAVCRASAAVADTSYPRLHFQCLEAWAENAAEGPSRGSHLAGAERCFLDSQQAHSLCAELLPFQTSLWADDRRKVAELRGDFPQAAERRDSQEDDKAPPPPWPVPLRSR